MREGLEGNSAAAPATTTSCGPCSPPADGCRRMIPPHVRYVARRLPSRRRWPPAAPARRRGQGAGRRPLAAADDEAAAGRARRAGRHRTDRRRCATSGRRRRRGRHRRARTHAPDVADVRRSSPTQVAAAGPVGRPRRRPAGAPPRHHRRLAGARRPRPPTCPCRAGRGATVGGRAGSARAARDRRRRVLPRLLQTARRLRTRCSSRSGCRRGRASRLGLREVHPAGQRLGDRRGRRRRRAGRAGQHGRRRRCGPRPTEEALAGGAAPPRRPRLAAEDTDPAEDMHADAAYRRHLAQVLTKRALIAAGVPA